MSAPLKGILKSSRTAQSRHDSVLELAAEDEDEEYNKKSQKWDEMNILATYHPEGKDYGLMKIDEPSTPYNRIIGDDDDDETAMSDSETNINITAEILAKNNKDTRSWPNKFCNNTSQASDPVTEGKGTTDQLPAASSSRLTAAEGINPKIFEPKEESSEDEEELSPEEQENKKQFEMKRKMHYNEGMNIKLARQLIAKELENAEEEDDGLKESRDLEDFEDDTDEELSEDPSS
ncbi:protein phosphatase inhibitor 2 [Amblyraja radiata]|uniref:protein phosphatase inhibitor 2 n=1 Tax=Amblyraja radiata TaxID=386614 RepID=UPI0014033645|nr:protein phosphatase inhibitor 2 [Amblyraja radiata]